MSNAFSLMARIQSIFLSEKGTLVTSYCESLHSLASIANGGGNYLRVLRHKSVLRVFGDQLSRQAAGRNLSRLLHPEVKRKANNKLGNFLLRKQFPKIKIPKLPPNNEFVVY